MFLRLWRKGGFALGAPINPSLFRYTGGRTGRFYGLTAGWVQVGVTLWSVEER